VTPDYFLSDGVPYTRFVNYRNFVDDIQKQKREASSG